MDTQPAVTHEHIVAEIRSLREEVQPLVAIAPDLKAMADIYTAGKIGGGAIKWLAGIGGFLTAIWLGLKALASALVAP